MLDTASDHFWESGLDYITVSSLGGERSLELHRRGEQLLAEQVSLGGIKKPWGMSGFHGWKCGPVQLGQRNKEVLARVSGAMAHDSWRLIYEVSDNCSRADCQVTVKDGRTPQSVIRGLYGRAKRFAASHHRERTISLLETNTGSSTCYFNRRVSERFGRIYDKGNESGISHYDGAVRYEVEFKGDVAARVMDQLVHSDDYGAECVTTVSRFLRERIPAFKFAGGPQPAGLDVSTLQSVSQRLYPSLFITDRERQLRWLAVNVSKTIASLHRAGYLQETLAALGLDHLVHADCDELNQRQVS